MKFLVALLFLFAFAASKVPTAHVGVNLSPFSLNSSQVFVDIFRQSSPFQALKAYSGGYYQVDIKAFTRDSNGYPTAIPSGFAFGADIGSATYAPGGSFVCLYDGEGQLTFSGDASVVSSQPNRILLSLKSTPANEGFMSIRIVKTNSTNYLRNIRILPEAAETKYPAETGIFNPHFLNRLRPFNVLRFAHWQGESMYEFSAPRSWSTRTTSTSQTQWSDQGVSVEVMVELANALSSSVFFSMPKECDAMYIQNFATYVRDHLKQSSYVYVEYSNSVGLRNQVAEKSRFVFSNFEQVFGPQGRQRLIFVVSPRLASYLPHYAGYFNNNFTGVDALAVSGYFGQDLNFEWLQDFSTVQSMTEEQVMDLARRSVLNTEVEDVTFWNRMKALGEHLDMITVDSLPKLHAGGYGFRFALAQAIQFKKNYTSSQQFLASQEQSLEDLLITAVRNSRIKDIFMDYYRRWKVVGGSTFIASKIEAPVERCLGGGRYCGSLGLMENINNPVTSSPKYAAILAVANGEQSALPFTSADLPTIASVACTPSCVWGDCIEGTCQCYEGYSGAACDVHGAKRSDCIDNIGVNINGIADWSSEWPFVDIVKSSRAWITQNFNTTSWEVKTDLELGSNGYPSKLKINQIAGSMMNRDLEAHYPAGTYVVLYDGDGSLSFTMDDVKSIRRGVGRIELDIVPSTSFNNGIFMRILRTNPANPIRNVRVIMPGFEQTYQTQIFHPMFLESLKQYSHIRFMDFQATNNHVVGSWSERSQLNSRSYAVKGAPVEVMISLINKIGVNAWFCMPHLADDNYITQFAQMVKQKMRPDVKIYIEYSNEVWGTLFEGGKYAQQQGLALGLSTDATQARFCYVALRSKQIFAIWKSVFGASDRSRLIFVISSQAVNPDVSKRMLECQNAYQEADALAIAPYFSTDLSQFKDISDLDTLMSNALYLNINKTMERVIQHLAIANQKNVKLITYESGQHLVRYDPQGTELAIAANRDPRMKQVYGTYLHELKKYVSSITQFNSVSKFTVYGSWGLLEWQNQDPIDAPKYQAMRQLIESTKKCPLNEPQCPYNCNDNGACDSTGKCNCYFGFFGQYCEGVKYIDNYDCGYKCSFDRGYCVAKEVTKKVIQNYRCDCKPGYHGHTCGLATCTGNCNYAGTCTDVEKCECYEGFTGSKCEIDCGCNGHGRCGANNTCICDAGFKFDPVAHQCVFDCSCSSPQQICIGPNECSCPQQCVNGNCENGQCKCWNGFGGADCSTPTASPNDNSPMGVNVAGVSYWTTQFAFVDAMKLSSQWVPLNRPDVVSSSIAYIWDTKDPIELRPDGYPARLDYGKSAAVLMMRDLNLQYPSGTYVCTYDGEGLLEFGFDAKIVKRRKGRIELSVTPQTVRDNGIFMRIAETNPSNPIRNIKVFLPGFEYKEQRFPFHPAFLDKLQRFSALRFMDWLHTNNPSTVGFNDHATPAYYTQTSHKGVAYEYIVDLCNRLNASPWITIPHTADQDYVSKVAKFLKQHLRANLKIYIEHSNEVWNALFPQYNHAQQMASLLGLGNSHKYHAKRSLEIFQGFLAEIPRNRLVFTVGTQLVSSWVTEQILTYPNLAATIDAVGIAPYFDCGGLSSNMNKLTTSSMDQIFTECINAIPKLEQAIEKLANVTKRYNVSLITYEAGPSLVEQAVIEGRSSETFGATDKLIAINRDPRMRNLYKQYMYSYKKTVGSQHPIFHFNSIGRPSKYGSWGLLEHVEQDPTKAPKYMGALDYIAEHIGMWNKTGCKDTLAKNYDPLATTNGPCVY